MAVGSKITPLITGAMGPEKKRKRAANLFTISEQTGRLHNTDVRRQSNAECQEWMEQDVWRDRWRRGGDGIIGGS